MNEIILRDVLRLADAKLSLDLWKRQQKGEIVFKSDYNPEERIAHYEALLKNYADYVSAHIKEEGTSVDKVIAALQVFCSFIPKELQQTIINPVKKLITDLL